MRIKFENLWEDKLFYLLPTIGLDIPDREIGFAWLCFGILISF